MVERHKSTLVNIYAVIRVLREFGASDMCWNADVLWPTRASNSGDVSASSLAAVDASSDRNPLWQYIWAVINAKNKPA